MTSDPSEQVIPSSALLRAGLEGGSPVVPSTLAFKEACAPGKKKLSALGWQELNHKVIAGWCLGLAIHLWQRCHVGTIRQCRGIRDRHSWVWV